MANIETREEEERGCGFRVPGGRYLIGGKTMEACGMLPVVLDVCPTCSGGIKFSRGWTWINGNVIVNPRPHDPRQHSVFCLLGGGYDLEKSGLLWVGERSYTPDAFTQEAAKLGVSRRIGYLPRSLVLGKTVILLAHKKVPGLTRKVETGKFTPVLDHDGLAGGDFDPETVDEVYDGPAIFSAFIPTHMEYVVKGDETTETLDNYESKGYTLVKVIKKGEK